MKFQSKLIKGKLIKRYKRFFIDVNTENGVVTAHCPNTGSMKGLLDTDNIVWLSKTNNPKRKLKFTWELVMDNKSKTLVGINTQSPNKIVHEALLNNILKNFKGYEKIRKEVKYGNNSRIDFLLEGKENNPCFIEVKNVHYCPENGLAKFPDSVTSRGQKHLNELIEVKNQGNRAVMLYIVQREDCAKFGLASEIDPDYYELFKKALKKGVEVLCFSCKISLSSISIDAPLEIID